MLPAARRFDVRTYRVTNERLANQTVAALEERLKETRTSIERIRHGTEIVDAEPGTLIDLGDVVAAVGRREVLVEAELGIGPEVQDFALMDFPAEVLDVVITNKATAGTTLGEIAASDIVRGVYLRKLIRGGHEMPFAAGTTIDRGDVLQIVGAQHNVERAAQELGYADRPTNATDLAFVGTGIALGGLLGALTIRVGGIPLTLSTSGGALIAGLVFGWLRSVNRTFGRVPAPALLLLNNVGLTTFIAVVGITAGPSFVTGLKAAGLSLLFAGIVVTSVPLIAGVLMAKHLFRFHPGIALGVVAGARTSTVALAGNPEAMGRGPLVVLNDEIHYAHEVQKTNSTQLDTFKSPNRGRAGVMNTGKAYFFSQNTVRHTTRSEFSLDGKKVKDLPRVEIVYSYANFGREMIDVLVRKGAKGIVLAGVGDGNSTDDALAALAAAAKKGVAVVRATRTGSGLVVRNVEVDDDKLGFIAAMELNPQKARVLLMLGLMKTKDPGVLQTFFMEY